MIRNLEKKIIADFSGGRVTSENQANIPENCLLVAKNVLLHSGAPQPIPGYTKKHDLSNTGNVKLGKIRRIHQFNRRSDQAHLLVVTGETTDAHKSGAIAFDADSNDLTPAVSAWAYDLNSSDADFIDGVHTLYMNNPLDPPTRMVNRALDGNVFLPWGTPTPTQPWYYTIETLPISVKWMSRATGVVTIFLYQAPTFAVGDKIGFYGNNYKEGEPIAGYGYIFAVDNVNWTYTLKIPYAHGKDGVKFEGVDASGSGGFIVKPANPLPDFYLQFGRKYVFCEVCKWTDSQGVERFTISAPNDINVNLGEFGFQALNIKVEKSHLATFTNYVWYFATKDLEDSDAYYFAAEIPVNADPWVTWVNTITDDDLDTTREAPWDNYPPPEGCDILSQFDGRAVFIKDDTVQLSGNEEIRLGDPMCAFPASLKYRLPSGSKKAKGAIPFQVNGEPVLLIGNEEGWFPLRKIDVGKFAIGDKVVSPGPVGRRAICESHGRLLWIGPDKKGWMWSGIPGDDPVPASASINASSDDQLSMDSLDSELMSDIELLPYSMGTFDFILAITSSKNTEKGEKDWIQMWDLSPIVAVKNIQGPMPEPIETDFFPTDLLSTATIVRLNGVPHVYFGDEEDGTIYRWPDGMTFNGDSRDCVIGSPLLKLADGKMEYKWIRLLTNVQESYQKFVVTAQAQHGTRRDVNYVPVEIDLAPDDDNPDTTVAKASLDVEGASFGQWLRWFVKFPDVAADMKIDAVEIAYRPVGKV